MKVAGAAVIHQIAESIGAGGANESEIGPKRSFEQVPPSVEFAYFLAFADDRVDSGGGVDRGRPAPPARSRSTSVP